MFSQPSQAWVSSDWIVLHLGDLGDHHLLVIVDHAHLLVDHEHLTGQLAVVPVEGAPQHYNYANKVQIIIYFF